MRKTALLLSLFLLITKSAMADGTHSRSDDQPLSTPAAQQTVPVAWSELDGKKLKLRSASVLVVDDQGTEIYSKHADEALPIASITKLMSVIVILDSGLPLDQKIRITKADRDLIRLTGSRLNYGATLSRRTLLRLALMASENRAARALARTYPGGTEAFVAAMNHKAQALGMSESHFRDPAGLDAGNVASARDLVRLAEAASGYQEIVRATTTKRMEVKPYPKRGLLTFGNTNRLLKNQAWDISLSKTGYINEAGRCLLMKATLKGRELTIVLLNSFGKLTPFGDSNRIRKWIERGLSG